MFRLMYFFMSFHHQLHQAAVKDAVGAGKKGPDLPKFELGHVLETMDLMSFNLVLREVETAISEKNTKRLAECVAVLKEMMHIVVSRGCGNGVTFSVDCAFEHGGDSCTTPPVKPYCGIQTETLSCRKCRVLHGLFVHLPYLSCRALGPTFSIDFLPQRCCYCARLIFLLRASHANARLCSTSLPRRRTSWWHSVFWLEYSTRQNPSVGLSI